MLAAAVLAVVLTVGAGAQTDIEKMQNAPWFAREIAQGVTWKYYHFDNLFSSEQDVHVTEVDMNVAGTALKFPHRTGGTRVTVPTFAADFANTAAAINGNFSHPPTGEVVQFFRVDGTLIMATWPDVQDEGAVVIAADGFTDTVLRPGSGNWADRTEPSVMASNVPLLNGGAHYPFPNQAFYMSDRHPRTAVGKTTDNKLLFVAVDGRRTNAAGMSLAEMRILFQGLGANNALNMDGGGSTTMWVKGEPGNSVVNVPSDGSLRAVPTGLSVVANPSTSTMAYDARYIGVSAYQATMIKGETQTVTMTFRNYGTNAWGPGTTLRTTEARDRTSSLFTNGQWASPSSPGTMTQPSVATGANATFTFTITAPDVSTVTTFTESFGVHDATGGWLGPEQNRLRITVLPGVPTGNVIIETRAGGQNVGWYDDTLASNFADVASNCTAPGLSSAIGSRYASTFRSVAGLKRAQFRPILNAGTYNVYVAWPAAGNRRANITYIVNHAGGQHTQLLDQTQNANTWVLLGTYAFNTGNDGSIEVNNSSVDLSGSFYTAGAMLEPMTSVVNDWSLY
ncbi:MAG: phosphodiester glycosidase family protein [Candidatus Sumerlaeia bacterium]|nr:phosphodiester glycosidase family protein [Candidatus Sumerlaeia bacterium]